MITDTKAKNLKPGDKPLPDGTVIGLTLIPGKAKGIGKWNLRFVSPTTGKRRDMELGTFPETGIAAARKFARDQREIRAQGLDPIDERRKLKGARESESDLMTFEKAAEQVHVELKPKWKNQKHADQWINTLRTYVFPMIGARRIASLTPKDFASVLAPIWHNKAETASRVKQRCDAVMDWAWGHDLVNSNPVARVVSILKAQPKKVDRVVHQPAMNWREVPTFVANTLRNGKTDKVRPALEFLILTAARSGEVRGMLWTEVDLENRVWSIPRTRMKAKQPHRVPLSARAMEILDMQSELTTSDLVFPSPRGKPLSDMALTSFLRNHKISSTEPGRIATAHGFRSSFRDWASEHRYPRDLAEKALAHTIKNATEAAYHRTDLLEERREMMEKWSLHVSGLSAPITDRAVP